VNHQHPWQFTAKGVAFRAKVRTIEDWQGPIYGLTDCACGERTGLIWLQAWFGVCLQQRVYALCDLPAGSAEDWHHALDAQSCQLERRGLMLDHLIASARQPATFWFVDLNRQTPTLVSPDNPPGVSFSSWQDQPLPHEKFWRTYLADNSLTTDTS